ncbi:MAG: choice-of-anchor Q domain-containing protein [Mariniphaga sp.]
MAQNCNCDHTITIQQTSVDGSTIHPGDIVCLEAGTRSFLRLYNFHGTVDHPIVFINCGGEVIIRDNNTQYGISIENSSYLRLTGTGSIGVKYGVRILECTHDGAMGIAVGSRSTNFELDHIEVAHTGFAGIMAKTDPQCDLSTNGDNFTQYQTIIHDNYVHDTGGEGLYIGHSFYGGITNNCDGQDVTLIPGVLKGVRIYNNMLDNIGWDGLQVSSATEDCEIYGNKVTNYGTSGTFAQNSGIQIGGGTTGKCYNNYIANGSGNGMSIFGLGNNDIYNNIILNSGTYYYNESIGSIYGIFVDDRATIPNSSFNFYNNTIVNSRNDGIRFMSIISLNNKFYNNIILKPGSLGYYSEYSKETSYINVGSVDGVSSLQSNNFFYKDLSTILFEDALNDNYRLTKNSPAVDAGKDLASYGINTDFDSNSRPNGKNFDLGAFEYTPPCNEVTGGTVNGTSPVFYGSPTGTMTLTGYSGSVVKWQKMKGTGSWIDINNLTDSYSETPTSTGTWQYRAVVKSGTCPVTYSGAFSLTVSPNTYTWNGNAHDNNWFTPGNWDSNAIPDENAHAIVTANTYKPTINNVTPAQCRDLTIQTGAKVTIGTGGALTVNGNLTNNAGETGLVIESGQSEIGTGTGSLKILGTSSGIATVQRYMDPDNKWHLVSAPVIQNVKSFLDNNLDIPILSEPLSPVTFGMRDYNAIENQWNNFFNENISSDFGIGKGYLLRSMTPITKVISFIGMLNSGTINVLLTKTGAATQGWNLIGNPFTSAICINSSSGTDNFIGINASAFETNFVGIYIWNDAAYKYDIINYASPAVYAQSGQGFFVKAKTDGLGIVFNPSMQVHQNAVALKSGTLDGPQIKLVVTNNNKTASTLIKFIEGTTKGSDIGYDAGLFKSEQGLNLYTKLVEDNGIEFQLQCLPPNGYDKMVIPVGIDSKSGGEIVLSIETVQLDPNCKVILEDKLTNTFTDLSNGNYKTSVLANTVGTGRFYLHTGDITSGLKDLVLPGKLTVYTKENTEIRVIGEVGDKAIATLFNGLGKVLLTKKMDAGNLNIIGLPNLNTGLYMLNIDDKGTTQTIKIIIR